MVCQALAADFSLRRRIFSGGFGPTGEREANSLSIGHPSSDTLTLLVLLAPAMAHSSASPPSPSSPAKRLLARILRTHWKALAIASVAVIGETAADVLEPWPITIIVDNILQGKRLSRPLGAAVVSLFGENQAAMLWISRSPR